VFWYGGLGIHNLHKDHSPRNSHIDILYPGLAPPNSCCTRILYEHMHSVVWRPQKHGIIIERHSLHFVDIPLAWLIPRDMHCHPPQSLRLSESLPQDALLHRSRPDRLQISQSSHRSYLRSCSVCGVDGLHCFDVIRCRVNLLFPLRRQHCGRYSRRHKQL
jgi:hypothetical protein